MEQNKKGRGRPEGTFKPKMNEAEHRRFINDSMKRIFDNHMSWTEYIEFCYDYGLSKSQANAYWIKVWGSVKEKFELEKDKLITKHLQKYWFIYDNAVKNGDMNTARQTLNDIAKMMGLNEPDKVEVSSNNQVIEFKFGTPDTK
jgi:polyhydroxyalkanoate synthesis regulator phasin